MTREELLKIAKPILFNTEMVKAILEGRKTVTRRVINLDLGLADTDKNDSSYLRIPDEYGDYHDVKNLCRYKIGDILYVRETWQEGYKGNVDENGDAILEYLYRADGDDIAVEFSNGKWRPSIHMPKEAARIFLKVTDVKVERLLDISEEQAIKEGFSDKFMFMAIWDYIYGNVLRNPFVWVIEFGREKVE